MYLIATTKVIVQKMMLIAPRTSVSVGVFSVKVEENTYNGLVPTSPYTTPMALYVSAKVFHQPFFCRAYGHDASAHRSCAVTPYSCSLNAARYACCRALQ